jgi:hypothetical protein
VLPEEKNMPLMNGFLFNTFRAFTASEDEAVKMAIVVKQP